MLRVGLTGGIGSGKSTVARRLASHGAVVVDADLLAREVVGPGSEGLAEVVAEFGDHVLSDDGTPDRPALGRVVFGAPDARRRLEAITHPRIRALTEQRFRAAPSDAVVVHDVPLLVELGYEDRYHLTVVVHADAEERVRRLVTERGSTEDEARSRIAAQADDRARRAAADVWLDNTAAEDDLLEAVDLLWSERLVPFEAAVRGALAVPARRLVELLPPDPAWAATGRRLAARVRRAAGERAVSVDHVGSTAVPGLAAKDVVDLQLVVPDLDAVDGLAEALAQAGFPAVPGTWSDRPKPAGAGGAGGAGGGGAGGGDAGGVGAAADGTGEVPALDGSQVWRKWLHGSADPARPVHLHVRAAGSPGARYALLFRDWLRSDEPARREYEVEKRRLALLHPLRADYAEAKEPWFTDVAWPRMQLWAADTGWTSPV